MTKMTLSVFVLLGLLFIAANHKKHFSNCNNSKQKLCLVIERLNHNLKPKNWRTAQTLAHNYTGNIQGLKKLWISGSAEPTTRQLLYLPKQISKLTHKRVTEIINIDLREETHGYLNGIPMTLRTFENTANLGKTRSQVLFEEYNLTKKILQDDEDIDVLLKSHFKHRDFELTQKIKIHSAETEENASEKAGIHYIRMLVTDHSAPRPDQVKKFVELVDNLPQTAWIHVHCAAGKGRTTTFMAMYDMLKNAKQVSFEDIIKRQAAYDSSYDLSRINYTKPDRVPMYQKRYTFLKEFYKFARNRKHTSNYEAISI